MKKLLTIAAVFAIGATASAASFKWTAANIYGSDGATKFTGNATVFAYDSKAGASTAVEVTKAAINAGAMATTYEWSSAVVDTTYSFYFVIEDGEKTFTSTAKNGVANVSSTTTVAFANMSAVTQTASNWVVAPEPTSGLLLFLGMAGLALKRKRA